jgi:C-terminal processing protease CtpA/Prc
MNITTFVALLLLLLLPTTTTGLAGQRYRVTLQKGSSGYGLRLVKLDQRVVILGIVPSSPASTAGGGLLKVGDAIVAVGNSPVPLKSTVRFVERLILQQKSLTIDLTILKNWQSTKPKAARVEQVPPPTVPVPSTPLPEPRRRPAAPKKIWRYLVTLTRTPTTGFGLQLRRKNNLIVIDAVKKDSVAGKTFLIAPEDKIEAINNQYVYTQTLDQVIALLRSTVEVKLVVLSATSGSVRESYLNVKLNIKQKGFLGMKMKYSSYNNSVYVDKIFRTGIVARDGQLQQGDNIVALNELDVVKSIQVGAVLCMWVLLCCSTGPLRSNG